MATSDPHPTAHRGHRAGDDQLPLRPLEKQVQERAREFSLPALLDVLHFLDYHSDEIEYRSHMSQVCPASLIQSVEIRLKPPRRKAIVTVNLGLLSVQSPLPSYFMKFAEQAEGEALLDYLGFFDHHLLKQRVMALFPERDRTLFADWRQTQSDLLQLIGLGSPSTLHWMFERVFPELGVLVERSTAQRPLKAAGAILGSARLGEGCAFGAATSVPVGGIDVTLFAEEMKAPNGVAWSAEAAQRLNRRIFAVLGNSDLHMTIYLKMLDQENWLQMQDDRYLGFEPLWDEGRKAIPLPAKAASGTPSAHGPPGSAKEPPPSVVAAGKRGPVPPPPPGKKPPAVPGRPVIPPAPEPPPPTVYPSPAHAEPEPKMRVHTVQLFTGSVKANFERTEAIRRSARRSTGPSASDPTSAYAAVSEKPVNYSGTAGDRQDSSTGAAGGPKSGPAHARRFGDQEGSRSTDPYDFLEDSADSADT